MKNKNKRILNVFCALPIVAVLLFITYVLTTNGNGSTKNLIDTIPNTSIAGIFGSAWGTLSGLLTDTFTGLFQLLISLVMQFIVLLLLITANLYLSAMAEVDSATITRWLNTATNLDVTTSFANIGAAMALAFTAWELLKYVWAYVTGEQPQTRPRNIIVRMFVYVAWAICAIPFSRLLFDIGQNMFKAMKDTLFANGFMDWINNFGNSYNFTANDYFNDYTFLEGLTDGLLNLLSTVVGSILIILALWNFLKLLFSTFTRFATIIFYVYFSPFAVGCGASTSLRGITSSWFKNFITTMVLWILDVWALYACLCLFQAGGLQSGAQWAMWSGCCYGFAKGALKLDELFHQIGMQVAKTSGSVIGDAGEIMSAIGTAAGIAALPSAAASGVNAMAGAMRRGSSTLGAMGKGMQTALSAGASRGRGLTNTATTANNVIGDMKSIGKGMLHNGFSNIKSIPKIPSNIKNTTGEFLNHSKQNQNDLSTVIGQRSNKDGKMDNKLKQTMKDNNEFHNICQKAGVSYESAKRGDISGIQRKVIEDSGLIDGKKVQNVDDVLKKSVAYDDAYNEFSQVRPDDIAAMNYANSTEGQEYMLEHTELEDGKTAKELGYDAATTRITDGGEIQATFEKHDADGRLIGVTETTSLNRVKTPMKHGKFKFDSRHAKFTTDNNTKKTSFEITNKSDKIISGTMKDGTHGSSQFELQVIGSPNGNGTQSIIYSRINDSGQKTSYSGTLKKGVVPVDAVPDIVNYFNSDDPSKYKAQTFTTPQNTSSKS